MAEIRTHQRKIIRQNVVTVLKNSVPAVSNRVYAQRKIPFDQTNLPAIFIYTTGETVSRLDNINYQRIVKLSIEIVNDGNDETELIESLDDLAEAVEIAVLDNEQFSGAVEYSILTGTDEAIDDGGKSVIGATRLQYDLVYYTENVADEGDDPAAVIAGDVKGYEIQTNLIQ